MTEVEKRLQIIEAKNLSQQHGSKHAELSQQHGSKHADLGGDVGKHLKIQNLQTNTILHTAAGTSTSAIRKGKHTNTNMNAMFNKPYTPKSQNPLTPSPQTTSYRESLNQEKQTYDYITNSYIQNIHKIQTFLNLNPRSKTIQNPKTDYITQPLQGYNRLIAQPGTNANLVKTCYNYGLLSTVYTQTGQEIATIPELYSAFTTYKRITKGDLFYIKFYVAPAEILYNEIKPIIQVIKLGLTREMIIPENVQIQPEIPKPDIPAFYSNKRIIGLSTILSELVNNYVEEKPIWGYQSREHTMIYTHSKNLRENDMEEIRRWIKTLIQPEEAPITRAIRGEFISQNLMTRYCKQISPIYSEHICSKCQGEKNIVPEIKFEEEEN
ncbi:uncharacterized protein [Nicotiana tomentosiformis]|uniref:uncharacterized protein n=1 Tax=Nicotiana tomentosiformis TaxID=4098 RepID=UPI00388C840A